MSGGDLTALFVGCLAGVVGLVGYCLGLWLTRRTQCLLWINRAGKKRYQPYSALTECAQVHSNRLYTDARVWANALWAFDADRRPALYRTRWGAERARRKYEKEHMSKGWKRASCL